MDGQGTLDFPDAEGVGNLSIDQDLEKVETGEGPYPTVSSHVLDGLLELGSRKVA
jgi:hypothetical protein